MANNSLKKTKKMYWLSTRQLDEHRRIASYLSAHYIEVIFFYDLPSLLQTFATRRTSTVIVDDCGEEDTVLKYISKLSDDPEFSGVKFILGCYSHNEKAKSLAAASGFRDIFPLEITKNDVISRFKFATANREIPIKRPSVLLATQKPIDVSLPGRITWISPQKIMIESKLKPEPGAVFNLTGDICRKLGFEKLIIKAIKTYQTNLKYQFSSATIYEWNATGDKISKVNEALRRLKAESNPPPCKVFAAVSNFQLRQEISRQLQSKNFHVRHALQRQNILYDPQFFNPHVVIIEEILLAKIAPNMDIKKFFARLPKNTHLVVFTSDLSKYHNIDNLVAVSYAAGIPNNLKKIIMEQIGSPEDLIPENASSDSIFLNSDSSDSIGELNIKGRLLEIHPSHLLINLSHLVHNFSLVKIHSSIFNDKLNRPFYIKLTSIKKLHEEINDADYINYEAVTSDLVGFEKKQISKLILDMISGEIGLNNAIAQEQPSTKIINSIEDEQDERQNNNDIFSHDVNQIKSNHIRRDFTSDHVETSQTSSKKAKQKKSDSIDDFSPGLNSEISEAISDVKAYLGILNRHKTAIISTIGAIIFLFAIVNIASDMANKASEQSNVGTDMIKSLQRLAPKKFNNK